MKSLKGKLNKNTLLILSAVLFLVFAVFFVYNGKTTGNQSSNAIFPSVQFSGEVRIGDGEAFPYVPGEHIPSTEGDVTLTGQLSLISPVSGELLGPPSEGTLISIYLNHLSCEISETGKERHAFDTELPIAGEDMCGIMCTGYSYRGGEELTVTLRNPHSYGNASAIDDFIGHLGIYGGTSYEKEMLDSGDSQRVIGIFLILSSFLVFGTGIFSLILKNKGSKKLVLLGFILFLAGVYFLFSARGVMYWSEIVKFNTRTLLTSVMLYVFFLMALVLSFLEGGHKKAGYIVLLLSAVSDICFWLLPSLSGMKFFDTLPYWTAIHIILSLASVLLIIHSFIKSGYSNKVRTLSCILPLIAFILDAVATGFSLWQGGLVSGAVLIILFLSAVVVLLRIIPKNVNSAIRARELEAERNALKAELTDSRIAIMISQIQPHFIYNTLGTIEQLCISDPKAASKLVRSFALYLRGNFSELDNARPIRFSKEMEHVRHYTNIEQVRFPDMTIQYDLRSVEFVLPALSVQPLVENAIKHGLMGLEEGGIVTISAFETEEFYIVEVTDDGVGFDVSAGYDEEKHVGIKNIRGRIEAMSHGTLTVESAPGKGTKATIKIPKEAGADESNNG